MNTHIPSKRQIGAGRPTVVSDAIVAGLRRDIISGKLRSGQRLPPHVEMKDQFSTTPVTMHRSIQRLVNEGFLRTEKRVGIYVAEQLPHLAHYALVFPAPESQLVTSQFYVAIRGEAGRMNAPDCHFPCYFDISGHVDSPDYERLSRAVATHCLAGEILAFNPFRVQDDPRLINPDIPWVAVMDKCGGLPFPTVYPDTDAFTDKALRYLVSQGRRRIAHLVIAAWQSADELIHPSIKAARAAVGLDPLSPWIQGIPAHTPSWARQVLRLMFHAEPGKRPDALIIHDDNLVPDATQCLMEMGLSLPDDLEVVAQTNFPWPTRAAVPVTRLGFNIAELMRACRARIDQQRQGERPPAHTLIPAIFEAEFQGQQGL